MRDGEAADDGCSDNRFRAQSMEHGVGQGNHLDQQDESNRHHAERSDVPGPHHLECAVSSPSGSDPEAVGGVREPVEMEPPGQRRRA